MYLSYSRQPMQGMLGDLIVSNEYLSGITITMDMVRHTENPNYKPTHRAVENRKTYAIKQIRIFA